MSVDENVASARANHSPRTRLEAIVDHALESPVTQPHLGGIDIGCGVFIHGRPADIDHYRHNKYMQTKSWISTGPGDMVPLEEVR
ncbi:hypothetical protein DEQ92_20450 [Haloferax sp. Atlit-6N]|uniref:hypothetical protein n=1 Tax=Haloferax sp. Atlit-6N TaxID=2077205 RepID=UPI000E25D327|nr:hypothetical protein [Haloferax sp. Atlit-6N]REA00224.1 hypothetical protein DEQ92_20450 [Haloferax sp. Atlit-6N]